VDATEATWERDVLAASEEAPVVVDFWAPWCGPCRSLAPVLERAVAERPEVRLVKVNVDESPALASRYGVGGIPAVKAFRRGDVVAEFVGARGPALVEEFLEGLTAPPPREGVLAELREAGDLPSVLEALEHGDDDAALAALLEQVEGAGIDERERLRDLMVRLFADLGQEHPLTLRYRRRLAAALY
jgi:putative thioredoxin